MSKTLYEKGGLTVTAFAGGMTKGRCLQLTGDQGHIQLTADQIDELVDVLLDWLRRRE